MPRGQYERRGTAQSAQPEQATETQAALSPRAAQERRERRRRDDGNLDRMGRMALAIPPEVQARWQTEGKVGRWVRDTSGRQAEMHANDWDVTPDVKHVAESRDSDGKLVLMEKYEDWYNDDQRRKSDVLRERDELIQRGAKVSPDDHRQEGVSYVPSGNSISRKPGP